MTVAATVTYEITVAVEPRLVEDYERYMREYHIPDVLATRCFQSAVLTRSTPGRYRILYEASSNEDLERYLAIHAARLREQFLRRFPEGVTLSREQWTALQRWNAPPDTAG